MHEQPASSSPDDAPDGPGSESDRNYEAAKTADFDIPGLQRMDIRSLMDTARAEGAQSVPGLSKQELIFEILTARARRSGVGWGEGVLDILPDGFGFLRAPEYDYEAGPDDIYVSPSQVRRLNLKQGNTLAGPVRPPKRGEKYFALLQVETVDGAAVGTLRDRIPFAERTPANPDVHLDLDSPRATTAVRLLDLLAPIGLGQRVLLSAPPRSGRTALLCEWTRAILEARAGLSAIVCLVDERPEDVTEMHAAITPPDRVEIVASTFDQPTSRHVAVAEMCLAKAMRRVEAGQDVLLVLDSLTQLVRAYNTEIPHTGKIVTAGLDSGALVKPKALFGAARNLVEGGSLTVIATLSTHTGSAIDAVIEEEFAGKANCEVTLDPDLAERRLDPPINAHHTGTRAEQLLVPAELLPSVRTLRRRLADQDAATGLEGLLVDLERTATNRELLLGLTADSLRRSGS